MPLVRMGAYNTPSGGLSVQNRSRDFVEPASIGGEGEIDSGRPGPRPSGAPAGVQNRSREFVEPASIGGEGEIDSGHPGPRPAGAPAGVQNRSRDFVELKLRLAERVRLTRAVL